MKCPNPDCGDQVPDHSRMCVVCGVDAGVPNVRAASLPAEVGALDARVLAAENNAELVGATDVLTNFRLALEESAAVVCRSISRVNELVSSDNHLFASFYKNVRSDITLPEDNEWDRIRQSADSLLFPHYFEDLMFAALTLDGSGVNGYGGICVTLKDSAIRERSSVFEENAILFIKRHRIVAGDALPLGYKATWTNRVALCVAKLTYKLTPATTSSKYQSILMGSTARDGDFIEVHIYGPLHRRAIKHVSATEPKRAADKVLLRSMTKKLLELGATCTIN